MTADTLTVNTTGATQVTATTNVNQLNVNTQGTVLVIEDDNLTVGDVHTTDATGNAINIDVTAGTLTSATDTSLTVGAGGEIGVAADGAVSLNTTGTVSFNRANVNGDLTLDGGNGTIGFNTLAPSGADNITVSANNINMGGNAITGDGVITLSADSQLDIGASLTSNDNDIILKGQSAGISFDVGAAATGDVHISQAEIDFLQAGTGTIRIGS